MHAMAEIQVTWWRDLPSLVVARDGDDVVKVPLPPRFQEAIDEAVRGFEEQWGDEAIAAYLDAIGPAQG